MCCKNWLANSKLSEKLKLGWKWFDDSFIVIIMTKCNVVWRKTIKSSFEKNRSLVPGRVDYLGPLLNNFCRWFLTVFVFFESQTNASRFLSLLNTETPCLWIKKWYRHNIFGDKLAVSDEYSVSHYSSVSPYEQRQIDVWYYYTMLCLAY